MDIDISDDDDDGSDSIDIIGSSTMSISSRGQEEIIVEEANHDVETSSNSASCDDGDVEEANNAVYQQCKTLAIRLLLLNSNGFIPVLKC